MADPNQQYYDNGQYPPDQYGGDQVPIDANVDVQYNPPENLGDHQQQFSQFDDQQHYGQQEFDGQQMYDPQYAGQPEFDGEYYGEEGDGQNGGDYQIPDILLLNHYCASAHPPRDSSEEAKQEADLSWEPVREWLRTHSADEVRDGAQQRGDSNMTALHVACRHVPPKDVTDVLLSIAGVTAQWEDGFGWLPIHYACACGADAGVIKSLAEVYPESRTTVDRRGRTPLHFALGNSNPDNPVSPDIVVLLSSTGAASQVDDNGMLPLHYACAYGAPEEALLVLTEAYDEAITTMDRLDRTPLHFALSNAGRKAAPAAVRLLLSLHKEIVDATHGGPLPLKVLAEYASTVRKDQEQRESVLRCLEHLLSFNPAPTADFFTALQALPDWLQESAVVMPNVQSLLNRKISQRFPTGVLLSDLAVQILVIVSYGIAVINAIDVRYVRCEEVDGVWMTIEDEDKGETDLKLINILSYCLFFGAFYFSLRFVAQIVSLLALGAFRVWLLEPTNWLDALYLIMVYIWAVLLWKNPARCDEPEEFQRRAALSVLILWVKLLAYARNTYIDFAVFLGGLFYVVRRLVAFLLCLCITLIAFSQMFFTIYRGNTELCRLSEDGTASSKTLYGDDGVRDEEQIILDLQCERHEINVYCTRWDAFLNTFTMLLGEVNDEQFKDEAFAVALFVLFMFLVVILLANVLIAIVTDSYKIIQDQRAAIVFWTNRLDFVAEMDGIANGPWKTTLKKFLGLSTEDDRSSNKEITFGKDEWKRLMELYDEDVDDGTFSLEFICYTMLRIFTAVVVIPLWILVGFLTFGSLWPPQVREAVFTSKVLKHSSEAEKDDELRKTQVKVLKTEVQGLKDDLMQELAVDRTQRVQMKSLVAERKQEIQSEMKHIKRVVAMLFEQQSSL